VTVCPQKPDEDVNCDDYINILDLLQVRDKLGTTDGGREDVNRDTDVNLLDLIQVRNAF